MAPSTRTAETLVVSPDRLFAAANELLKSIDSPDGFDTKISMYAGPLPDGASVTAGAFTCEELIEAMDMLTRLGFIPAGRRALTHSDHVPTLSVRKAG